MNIIEILGHLGADPETRFTPDGAKVTTFRVAVNVRKSGKDETIWFRVTVWGDRFDKMLGFLKKGSAIIVFGELKKPEIYTDKEGRQQISLEITAEMLKFSPFGKGDKAGQEGGSNQSQTPYATSQQKQPAATAAQGFSSDFDDELPF